MSRIVGPAAPPVPVQNTPLDRSQLAVLTEAELDAADDDGLGGNGEYQDLQACDIDDLREAVAIEAEALRRVRSSSDQARAEDAYRDGLPMDDERAALWHLDLGVGAACVALVTLGARPVLSCNGGEFGSPHVFPSPLIRLYLEDADPVRLVDLANRAGIGLGIWEGKIIMQADTTDSFHQFGRLVLADSDARPTSTLSEDRA
ncbi:MAG: hypothetical protein PSV23_16165 [Brevundimonas sp.]|uniref:hypothetical protein n=1 Tax=Brevundimonas sp. TaxID=1871086 RepID=UPI0024889FFD|nr:hypothetical protein [Brevundimonas sp.]MDI1328328.1 hypothetical protein [Brevundimonas sp.]